MATNEERGQPARRNLREARCQEREQRREATRRVFQELVKGGDLDCQNLPKKELCEEFVEWGTEISEWLWELWDEQYSGSPGTVDPPPPPPFKP